MGFHHTIESMLQDSLPGYMAVAKAAVNFPAERKTIFHGYAAATLLFSLVDAIGCFYRGNPKHRVWIDVSA